jgi:hypothetical protein
MRSFVKNYKISVPILLVITGALAWLAFGYFGVQGLVIDDVVDEAVPTFDEPNAVVVEASGSFVGLDHGTSGTAVVLADGTGQRFLRLEDFKTSNGPDVNVYLVPSSSDDVTDFVDLGNLRGNIGNQNYAVPLNVDLGRYDRVLIWCVRFSSPFGRADLMTA